MVSMLFLSHASNTTSEYQLCIHHLLYSLVVISSIHDAFSLYYQQRLDSLVQRVLLQRFRVMELEGRIESGEEWIVELSFLIIMNHWTHGNHDDKDEVVHSLQFAATHVKEGEVKAFLEGVKSVVLKKADTVPSNSLSGRFFYALAGGDDSTLTGGDDHPHTEDSTHPLTLSSLLEAAQSKSEEEDENRLIHDSFCVAVRGASGGRFVDIPKKEAVQRIQEMSKKQLTFFLLVLQYLTASESTIWEEMLDLLNSCLLESDANADAGVQAQIAYMLRTVTVCDGKRKRVNRVLTHYSCKL